MGTNFESALRAFCGEGGRRNWLRIGSPHVLVLAFIRVYSWLKWLLPVQSACPRGLFRF